MLCIVNIKQIGRGNKVLERFVGGQLLKNGKKLTKEEKCQFGTMPEDPTIDVGESSIVKMDEEKRLWISMTNIFYFIVM